MTEHELRELQVRIARYRHLKRETTDPLAECLLEGIVTELEADLKDQRHRAAHGAALIGQKPEATGVEPNYPLLQS